MGISAENWERIDRLFSQALEVAPEARNAFLSKQCSDQAVIGRVRELLASHEKADGFLNDEHRAQIANGVMRTALTFKEGDLLADRFKIVRFIDRGGMGDVYEAEDVYLHMQVAIKAIRPDLLDVPGFQERFKREVKLAKEVAHRNVCRVYDMHPVPGGEVLFVSMELLVGETLALRLKRPDRITGEEAVELIRQMAAALGAIHDKGILHRDFKPENVVLVEGNSPGTLLVKVTDFGLAFRPASRRSGSGALTTQNLILGTPEYMSPEQAQPPDQQRELTRASDIYSLGLVIYEMLTGNRPLEAVTPWGTVQRRIAETIPRLAQDLCSGLARRVGRLHPEMS